MGRVLASAIVQAAEVPKNHEAHMIDLEPKRSERYPEGIWKTAIATPITPKILPIITGSAPNSCRYNG